MGYLNLSTKVTKDGICNRPCAGRISPKTVYGNDHRCDPLCGWTQHMRYQARLPAPALRNQGNTLPSLCALTQLRLNVGSPDHRLERHMVDTQVKEPGGAVEGVAVCQVPE